MQIVYAKSVQGQSHKKREELPENKERGRLFPCEDRSCAEQGITADDGTAFTFLCVCDGHGGAPYFRSGRGAEFAIAVYRDLLVRRMEKIRPLALEGKFKDICSNLAHAVNRNWRAKIDEDLQANPPTEEELSTLEAENADAAAAYRRGEDLYSIYGCTMIAYFATAEFWFALQIGDGGFALSMDGTSFTMPVPEDPKCFLNQTTSLCDTDAVKEFRHAAGTELPKAVFCMTDGVENSFSSPEQLCAKFCGTVAALPDTAEFADCAVCKKTECDLNCRRTLFEKEIADYLPVLSRKGSGDDVSVALLVQLDERAAKGIPGYLRGVRLYGEGHKPEGIQQFKLAADAGNAKAQERFADLCKESLRGFADAASSIAFLKQAQKYYELAAAQGSASAAEKLSKLGEDAAAVQRPATVPAAQPVPQTAAAAPAQPAPTPAAQATAAPLHLNPQTVQVTPAQAAAAYARQSVQGYGRYVGVRPAAPVPPAPNPAAAMPAQPALHEQARPAFVPIALGGTGRADIPAGAEQAGQASVPRTDNAHETPSLAGHE